VASDEESIFGALHTFRVPAKKEAAAETIHRAFSEEAVTRKRLVKIATRNFAKASVKTTSRATSKVSTRTTATPAIRTLSKLSWEGTCSRLYSEL
jgi:hypothetical protein